MPVGTRHTRLPVLGKHRHQHSPCQESPCPCHRCRLQSPLSGSPHRRTTPLPSCPSAASIHQKCCRSCCAEIRCQLRCQIRVSFTPEGMSWAGSISFSSQDQEHRDAHAGRALESQNLARWCYFTLPVNRTATSVEFGVAHAGCVRPAPLLPLTPLDHGWERAPGEKP